MPFHTKEFPGKVFETIAEYEKSLVLKEEIIKRLKSKQPNKSARKVRVFNIVKLGSYLNNLSRKCSSH